MSDNITETITAALPSGVAESYGDYVSQVAEALLEREYDITDAVIEGIEQHFGVSRDEVLPYVEEVGLSVRPQPEPTEVPTADAADLGERIARLEGAVASLVTLAETHLGGRVSF